MEKCVIRPMIYDDVDPLMQGFMQQGWDTRHEVLFRYLKEEKEGKRLAFSALWEGNLAGYVTLIRQAEHGPFAPLHLPEIADFNVLEKYRRRGIGSALLDEAEKAAKAFSPVVTLGVGLHHGYGPAQRLYVKRGYVPDGSGVWFENKIAKSYEPCFNGDDLVLYLSKSLE